MGQAVDLETHLVPVLHAVELSAVVIAAAVFFHLYPPSSWAGTEQFDDALLGFELLGF